MKYRTTTFKQLRETIALIISTSFFALSLASGAQAFTSIAYAEGQARTVTWAASYDTQTEADDKALEGCRSAVKKNKLNLKGVACQVQSRAERGGYGAMACSTEGCGWVTGDADRQHAIDAAYQNCSKNFNNCQTKNIDNWQDTKGLPLPVVSAPRPQPRVVTNCNEYHDFADRMVCMNEQYTNNYGK